MTLANLFLPENRSLLMAKISSKHTKPEMKVRRFLHARGIRYRLHVKALPGTPDLVLPKYKTVIQVRGCFWHQHSCSEGRIPKTRRDFWASKLSRNVERDKENDEKVKKLGWSLIVIWECDLKSTDKLLNRMEQVIKCLSTSQAN